MTNRTPEDRPTTTRGGGEENAADREENVAHRLGDGERTTTSTRGRLGLQVVRADDGSRTRGSAGAAAGTPSGVGGDIGWDRPGNAAHCWGCCREWGTAAEEEGGNLNSLSSDQRNEGRGNACRNAGAAHRGVCEGGQHSGLQEGTEDNAKGARGRGDGMEDTLRRRGGRRGLRSSRRTAGGQGLGDRFAALAEEEGRPHHGSGSRDPTYEIAALKRSCWCVRVRGEILGNLKVFSVVVMINKVTRKTRRTRRPETTNTRY